MADGSSERSGLIGAIAAGTARLRAVWGGAGSRPRPEATPDERSIPRPEAFPGSAAAAWAGAAPDFSGSWITPADALTVPAVYAAVNSIASDLGSLPLELRRPTPSGGSEVVSDHPAAMLFSRSPDGGASTPQQFLRSLVASALVYGNGYARTAWSGGYPVALKLLDAGRVQPIDSPDGGRDYQLGGDRPIPGSQVVHLAALSLDGREGESPVELCRQTLGLSRAAESYAAAYFGAGASLPGFFAMPGSQDKIEETRKNIKDMYGGPNRHVPGVFPTGTSYQEIGGSPQESQLLELRNYQVLEVARIFRIPPHKLGDYSKASYASVEQANLSYYLETLRPWAEALESALGLKLLTSTELAAGWYWAFDFGSLLRSDLAARAAWIRNLAASGLLRVDEGRALADLPPLGGEQGRQILVPLNTGPLEKVVNPPEVAK